MSTDPLAASYEHCRRLARRTAKNFYYSFLTLPRARRDAMCALYAFLRVTDDLGDDDNAPPEQRARALSDWRDGLLRACEGDTGDNAVLPAAADMLKRFQVPRQTLLDVIAGVEMDLQPVAFATFDRLEHYCYHVAGAVGIACIHVWGFHDERALPAAVDCGTALQLTNILRDLREDAARGRQYLPQEDLDRFGVSSVELTSGDRGGRFEELMRFQVARAREYYARAQPLFQHLEPPGRPILEAMLGIYGGLLDEIERRRYDVFSRRIELNAGRKLAIAARAILRHKLGWPRGRSDASSSLTD